MNTLKIQVYHIENVRLKKEVKELDQKLQQIIVQFNGLKKSNTELKKNNFLN